MVGRREGCQMSSDPSTIRFSVGKTYRLHTSKEFPLLLGGSIHVLAELSPRDRWGNRILLVDAHFDKEDGGTTDILGGRCFVEEGYTESVGVYGARTIPVEIATVQGTYPSFAKAYANADLPNPNSGFTYIPAKRIA